jgi:type IV pilus assembly protein PilV
MDGFTLIEVLVAILVLAIGLLGLAGLQVSALRNNQSAYLRSEATRLAYDLSDRMRANYVGVNNGNYNHPTPSSDDCLANTCTPDKMASYDFAGWTSELSAQLPGGKGAVCLDSTPDDGTSGAPACDGNGITYAIKIWWDDSREGASNQRFVTSFQP